jgi:ankyrin repeat protein
MACLLTAALAGPVLGNRLHDAIKVGEADKVKALVKSSPELLEDQHDADSTPLFMAVQMGNEDMVQALLDAGAKVDHGTNSQTPLHVAIAKGYQPIAEALLKHKADANAADSNGQPPLFQAVIKGDKDLVTLLIDHGAKVSVEDKQGATPMAYAMTYDKPELMELLESKGAKPDLFVRVYRGDVAKVKAALKEDSQRVHAVNWEGRTALHIAAQRGSVETLALLLDAGAKVNTRDHYGFTPLHLAGSSGQDKAARRLLAAGADPNVKDRRGCTPVHLTMLWPEIMAIIVERGGDVNAQDNQGQTVLHHLVVTANAEKVKTLLELGPNLNIRDKEGRTPLALAKPFKNVAELLREYGAKE